MHGYDMVYLHPRNDLIFNRDRLSSDRVVELIVVNSYLWLRYKASV